MFKNTKVKVWWFIYRMLHKVAIPKKPDHSNRTVSLRSLRGDQK